MWDVCRYADTDELFAENTEGGCTFSATLALAVSRSEQVRKRNNRVKRTDDAFWNYFEFIENVIVCGKDRSAHDEF